MDGKKLLHHLAYLIFFILVVDFLAHKFHWYFSIWYLDMIMHFLGGFWLGLVCVWFLGSKETFKLSIKMASKILLFVLLIAVGWEVFQMLVNDFFAQRSFNFIDTISDILFGLLGGLCAILYILVPLKKERTGIKD